MRKKRPGPSATTAPGDVLSECGSNVAEPISPGATTQAPASWRDVLPVHPAADLFPLMGADELRALGEDIKQHGLAVMTVLWEAAKGEPLFLLDGRNRFDAMEAAGLSVLGPDGKWLASEVDWRCNRLRGGDPYEIVMALNFHRRHLTAEQKRDLIAKLIKATPEKSDREIAKQVKSSHPTVGKVRREAESTGKVLPVERRIGADNKARKPPATKPKPNADKPDRAAGVKQAANRAERRVERPGERGNGSMIKAIADRAERGRAAMPDDIGPDGAGERARERKKDSNRKTRQRKQADTKKPAPRGTDTANAFIRDLLSFLESFATRFGNCDKADWSQEDRDTLAHNLHQCANEFTALAQALNDGGLEWPDSTQRQTAQNIH